MTRARRGYVLMEALAAGAVLALAVAGLLTGLHHASGHVGRARMDREAMHRAQQELERLRTLPLSSAAWNPGTSTPCAEPPPPGWTCTVEIAVVTDNAVAFPAPLTYRRALVRLGRGDLQWSLDTFR